MADKSKSLGERIRRRELRKKVRKQREQSTSRLSLPEFAGVIQKIRDGSSGLLDTKGAAILFDNRYESVREAFSRRSKRSRETDKGKLAKLTLSEKEWRRNPDKFDFPGVDTPGGANLTDRLPTTFFKRDDK